jgi:NADPH-dependent curcumin reductase
MSDSKNRRWILESRPARHLAGNEFRWNETAIPKPSEGQILIRNLWLSFDPTQRGWMSRDSYVPMIPLGEVMRAISVGQGLSPVFPNSNAATSFRAGGAGRIILSRTVAASEA